MGGSWKLYAAAAAALVIITGVIAVVSAVRDAGGDVEAAQGQTRAANGAARVAIVRETTQGAVAEETARQATQQVIVERVVVTQIQKVRAHVESKTPIPADLARDWIAGLERVCDKGPADACPVGGDDRSQRDAQDE
jgi:hypothetical protein